MVKSGAGVTFADSSAFPGQPLLPGDLIQQIMTVPGEIFSILFSDCFACTARLSRSVLVFLCFSSVGMHLSTFNCFCILIKNSKPSITT